MENITELVKSRRSVRTFDGRELTPEDTEKLSSFMKRIENPYDIPVEFVMLDAGAQSLKCPVVSGTDMYIAMKVPRVPHAEEAVGYAFEMLVLYAQSLGIGTVWIGGTMDRAAFERAAKLGQNEMMPCVSPLGYPAKKMALKESMMRKAVRADSRAAFEELFFDGSGAPLTKEKAGALALPLEMVRLAPSAVNKQPWRVLTDGSAAHFFLKRSKGFTSEAAGDMQKIDMGIALCHFALTAKEAGTDIRFSTEYSSAPPAPDMEYIASYLL